MAETTQNPTPETITVTVVEEKTGKFRTFVRNHPRTAKVLGITAGAAAIVGVIAVAKGRSDSADFADGGSNVFDAAFSDSPSDARPAAEA